MPRNEIIRIRGRAIVKTAIAIGFLLANAWCVTACSLEPCRPATQAPSSHCSHQKSPEPKVTGCGHGVIAPLPATRATQLDAVGPIEAAVAAQEFAVIEHVPEIDSSPPGTLPRPPVLRI
jgi:hypothetical protein